MSGQRRAGDPGVAGLGTISSSFPTTMAADPELAANLAAVAHLIHGSTEGRFTVTYAPGPELSRAQVESVGFRYLALDAALERFPLDAEEPRDSFDGEPFAYVPNPGLGLWRI